ncbi:hypothetical protein ACFYWY_36295 [Streptomyces sp. NPDC002870]|uniref:hypothetical protein n=1 Tax=Streptomyces sp. NPDC002870 TaxID=3364666 RepID=UPI00369FC2B5
MRLLGWRCPDLPNVERAAELLLERTFSLLHHFKRLAVRWVRRLDLHDALVSLACGLICWRRLKKTRA